MGSRFRFGFIASHGFEGRVLSTARHALRGFCRDAQEDNVTVANISTPAQYFHALRRQKIKNTPSPDCYGSQELQAQTLCL